MRWWVRAIHAIRVGATPALMVAGLAVLAMIAAGTSRAASADTATTTRLNLVPGSTTKLQINFGTDRSPRTSVVTLISTPAASDASAYLLGDLSRVDGSAQLSSDRVSVKATVGQTLAGSTEAPVEVSLRVDPGNTQPGSYEGAIRIVSGNAEPVTLPVTITLQGGPGWLVAILLAVGAVLGVFTKWLSEVGSVLSDANRRFVRVSLQVQGSLDHVPLQFQKEIDDARTKILQLDAQAAT